MESTASNYEIIDLAPTIAADEEVVIDIAEVEQAILVVPCDESITFEEVIFAPSADPVGMTTGLSSVPDISPAEVRGAAGADRHLRHRAHP